MDVVPNYVRCRISGDACMRFVNLCRNNGVELVRLVMDEEGYQTDIRAEDFKKLRPLIRKTKVKIHILNRRGPAFFFYRHKYRLWFLAGMAAASLWIWYLSLFVWQIDIVGNERYTDALIIQSLRTMNVETGCRKSDLSLPLIEEELRILYNQITWVSASVTGTRLRIEVKEGNLQLNNKEEDMGLPSNVAAKTDATITSMVIRHGTAAVKTGDQVKSGDVLVEGKVYLYNDDGTLKKIDYTTADAVITGDYQTYYVKEYPRQYTVREYTKKQHRTAAVMVGNKLLKLPDFYVLPELCEIWCWQKRFRLTETFYLPFSIYYTDFLPYELVEKVYTDKELRQMAADDLKNYLDELVKKGVQIIGNSVTILLDADGGHAEGVLSLNGPVGENIPIDSDSMAVRRQN